MTNTYIALDLETTGFDATNDQVIEIAAIKFSGTEILEKFETLVNPQTDIPAMVSHITGIGPEQIKDAPTFDQISDNLTRFLGNYPIVGHNINFDLTFLEAKGIPILNKEFDTLQLSSILLPNLPSYSLDTISRQLKLEHKQRHRAMSDAHVCFQLFNLLLDKISAIPHFTLKDIQTQISKANWDLGELFLDPPQLPKKVIKNKTPKTKAVEEIKVPEPTSSEEVQDLLNANSCLKLFIKDFETRPSQTKLLDKILRAFQENFHLLAEAGTGTGKTLAYLLAAAFKSSQGGEKIIISTHTNNLQDQIIHKDFEIIHKFFPKLSITTLKGRRKYLSLNRFNNLKSKTDLEEHELTAIIKILIWLNHTTTGDLDEVNLQNKEIVVIDDICSTYESKPDYFKEPEQSLDFLDRARLQAENSDIIVVNHALLIQDALSPNKILPQSHFLIIDEAHHLEKTTTDALTLILSIGRIIKPLDQIEELLENFLLHNTHLAIELNPLSQQIHSLKIQLIHCCDQLFEKINVLLNKYAKSSTGQPTNLSLNYSLKNTDEWQMIVSEMNSFRELQPSLQEFGKSTQKFLHNYEPKEASEILNYQQNLEEIIARIIQIPGSLESRIIWMSKGFDESITLMSAPLSITEELKINLFDYKKSVILTSATLTTFGNFKYLRSELGLGEEFEEIKLASHFNYPDQVKIIIPENLPEPKRPEYIEDCKDVIYDSILSNKGRTLVLFTAKKELAMTFHDLAPRLKKLGIDLLGQGLSGGRGKIISHFQDEPEKCAILGTNSFWEGVDLPGDLLTCVIIQKLPFDPPDDPIIYARSQKFRDPFQEYCLPRAILRFKQGFGRLIRGANDTGSVIILDSRLVQKRYGLDFISSLPEGIKIEQCSKDQVSKLLN